MSRYSLFCVYSYITLVTGIGWDERNAEDQKDSHRYSVYNLNLRSNSCEILIRKTCTNGTFDYDNDVLLTKKEKKDKRIHLPIKPFNCRPVIEIPVYINDEVKNEYLFIDNCTVEKIKVISELFYTISNHMKQFQASHIHDFFIKFELDKKSKGTIKKQDIYNDYFYKNIENDEVTELFANIKNREIIYENFLSYLRELCGSVAREFKNTFSGIDYIRLHFRKYFKVENSEEIYIAICQATAEKESPEIRDVNYDSMIKIAFEQNKSFVYIHNTMHNPLSISDGKYDNFITMAPKFLKNTYVYKREHKDYERPYLTASLSVKCNTESNILDILNYLDINKFIFGLIYDYVDLFKIDMKTFISEVK